LSVSGIGNHPYHQHVNHFQITAMSADDPVYFQVGDWGDTIFDGAGSLTLRFYADKFVGRMVVHCHILTHEDQGMMGLWYLDGTEGTEYGAQSLDSSCYTETTGSRGGDWSVSPTAMPILPPTSQPTVTQTLEPSSEPIMAPTPQPSVQPTPEPSHLFAPTSLPIPSPIPAPTSLPIIPPTAMPVLPPSPAPSVSVGDMRFTYLNVDYSTIPVNGAQDTCDSSTLVTSISTAFYAAAAIDGIDLDDSTTLTTVKTAINKYAHTRIHMRIY
jgi:hypothetical protein